MRNVHDSMQAVDGIRDARARAETRLRLMRSSPRLYSIWMSA